MINRYGDQSQITLKNHTLADQICHSLFCLRAAACQETVQRTARIGPQPSLIMRLRLGHVQIQWGLCQQDFLILKSLTKSNTDQL